MSYTYKVTAKDGNVYIIEGVNTLTFEDGYWTLYAENYETDDGTDVLGSYHLPIAVFRQDLMPL